MRMRLAEKNIKFVKEFVNNGITYYWYVGMKSGRTSDNRNFINYESNVSVVEEYSVDRLPKTVQKYIAKHKREFLKDVDGVQEFIYR